MDSLDQVQQIQTKKEQRWVAFQKKLAPFPNFFQLADCKMVSTNHLKGIKNQLEATLQVGFKTDFETVQALNLVAYILFCLKQPEQALDTTDRALSRVQEMSIVSLANKAAILWHMERNQEADDCLRLLQSLQKNEQSYAYSFIKAKAEMAACYTRFGPRFTRRAVQIYDEVIPHGKEPEVWAWMYGRAVKSRQALSLHHAPVVGAEDSKEKHLYALRLFQDVVQKCQCKNTRAKAYVEMASLLDALVDQDTKNALLAEAGMTALEACEKALLLDDADSSVLTKVGNVYRHARQYMQAREYLAEKASAIQPTSRGYHYLGLTFKVLAKQNLEIKGQESVGISDNPSDAQGGSVPKEGEQSEQKETVESPWTQYLLPEHVRGTADDVTKSLVRRIKSLPQGTRSPELSRDDKYVDDAMKYLSLAVEFSSRTNIRAMLDLAMMHKALGEFNIAVSLLNEICFNNTYATVDLVTAYEQKGLIIKAMSECEEDSERKRQLEGEAARMLYVALSNASRLYAKTPEVRDRLGDVWHSFSTLLKSVDESSRGQDDKLREKARLFWLIKKHKESLNLLQEIARLAPEKANDPQHLKLMIENLVEEQRYSEALAFVELLQCTQQASQTLDLFEDRHYVPKIYVSAAREALLEGKTAKDLFHTVFSDTCADAQPADSSSYDSTDPSEDEASSGGNQFDIMLLHDESIEDLAVAFSAVLRDACGLNVTRMDDDVPLGKIWNESIVSLMKLSRQVVVLTGPTKRISADLRVFISSAAKRPATLTLTTGSGKVPSLLKGHRSSVCPPELFQLTVEDGKRFTESEARAVCDVFCVLTGIESTGA